VFQGVSAKGPNLAERDRQVDESDLFFGLANDEMKNSIKKADELLPKLKELLLLATRKRI